MANQWLRLWHDMPTDPKFRVIAKASGQPLHLVIALYVVLLVDASANKSRGVTKCHDENLAVTLDCDMSQVEAIKSAMQGRLLEGNVVSGWDSRQVKREDSGDDESGAKSAAARKAEQRERDKRIAENTESRKCHDMSRNVTTEKRREDKELTSTSLSSAGEPSPPETKPVGTRKGLICGLLRKAGMQDSAPHYLTDEVWETILAKRTDEEIVEVAKAKMAARPNERIGLKYIAKVLLQDAEPIEANIKPRQLAKSSPRVPAPDNFANRDYGTGGRL